MDAGEEGGIILGRGIGNVMVTFFGGVWLALSLLAAKEFSWWAITTFAVCFMGLYAGSVILIRRGRKLASQAPVRRRMPAAMRKQFLWAVAAEIVGCLAVASVCNWLGTYAYIAPGIALIVGLHFIPLAKIFRTPAYYLTAAAIIACCAASWIFLRAQRMDEAAGVGTGVVLWLTAAYDLIRSRDLLAAIPASASSIPLKL